MFFKFLINIYYLVYFDNIFDDNKSKIIIFEVNFFFNLERYYNLVCLYYGRM